MPLNLKRKRKTKPALTPRTGKGQGSCGEHHGVRGSRCSWGPRGLAPRSKRGPQAGEHLARLPLPAHPTGATAVAEGAAESSLALGLRFKEGGLHGEAQNQPHVKDSQVPSGGDTVTSGSSIAFESCRGPRGTEDRPGVSSPKAELPEGDGWGGSGPSCQGCWAGAWESAQP